MKGPFMQRPLRHQRSSTAGLPSIQWLTTMSVRALRPISKEQRGFIANLKGGTKPVWEGPYSLRSQHPTLEDQCVYAAGFSDKEAEYDGVGMCLPQQDQRFSREPAVISCLYAAKQRRCRPEAMPPEKSGGIEGDNTICDAINSTPGR